MIKPTVGRVVWASKPDNYYCEWMPYQVGQAAKYDELKAKS